MTDIGDFFILTYYMLYVILALNRLPDLIAGVVGSIGGALGLTPTERLIFIFSISLITCNNRLKLIGATFHLINIPGLKFL
jgi:hypothetical protein